MKTHKREILIFAVLILLLSLLKNPFVTQLEDVSFFESISSYYIYYGGLTEVNIIWLAPIMLTMFFISKNVYLMLMNFNIRYHDRIRCFIHIIRSLITRLLIYGILSLILQLAVFLYNTSYVFEWNGDLVCFIIKYIIELGAVVTLLLLIAVLLQNYTYGFVITMIAIVIILMMYKGVYIPFITLYVNEKINIISIIMLIINIGILYQIYLKRDIMKGITK